MAVRPRHRLPAEHIYEGLPFSGAFPPDILDAVKDFDLTGDVLLVSYPKTGTTWMQELLWLVNSEGDFYSANSKTIDERVPYLEIKVDGFPSFNNIIETPHPRLLQSHLPATFFKKQLSKPNVKIILMIRNPKDTLVSYYHFYRMFAGLGNFEGIWDEFFDDLVRSKHLFCGDYFQWYMGWSQNRHQANVKMVHYEDMKRDLKVIVEDVATFLGKTLSQEMVLKITEHLSFTRMKENKMTNFSTSTIMNFSISPFMRKGEVGDWKNYFTPEQNEYIDREYRDSLHKAGIHLRFE